MMHMREIMQIVEGASQPSYEEFVRDWGDYVLEMSFADDLITNDTREEWEANGREFSFEAWLKHYYERGLHEISRLSGKTVYRGMAVGDQWLHDFQNGSAHVGIHWSDDKLATRSFSRDGSNHYDNRFSDHGSNSVVLMALVDLDSLDVNATIATNASAHESEIRFKKNAPVFIISIMWNGEQIAVNKEYRA